MADQTWRLVPVEATPEMEQAAADYLGAFVKAHRPWEAMLTVAPTPPAPQAMPPVTLPEPAFRLKWRDGAYDCVKASDSPWFVGDYKSLQTAFAWSVWQAATSAERERAAKVVEQLPHWIGPQAKSEVAAAIRSGA